jgi:aldose 1-epimerase
MADATTAQLRSAQASPSVHALAAGPMRATIRPSDGGRIASFWRQEPGGDRIDVLVPMPEAAYEPAIWPKAGSYPLVPYSNRIRDAAFRFGKTRVQLVPHPAAAPHALHGFCQMRPWTVTRQTAAQIEMRYRHDPRGDPDGWPWAFEAIQLITLAPSGLTHEISVESRAETAMPMGLGVHPYFAVSQGDRIRFTADALWEADTDGCGKRLQPLAGSARHHDTAHGGTDITSYYAGWDGGASIERQDGSLITIQASAPLDHLVFHVPAGGRYLCLEPVSHVADAFNLAAAGLADTGMRVLQPGETMHATVRIGVA